MLNLVRGTCKFVTLETHDLNGLISFIDNSFNVIYQGAFTEELLNEVFTLSNEGNVIVIATDKINENVREKDMDFLFLLDLELEQLFSEIINQSITAPVINKVKLSPRILLIRTVGDVEKVIDQVVKDINGKALPSKDAMDNIASGTLVYFSNNALHKPQHLTNTYKTCVHTTDSYYTVFRYLRNQNLKYLNIGIDNNDWHELKIKIYDAYGHFDLHYNRMRYVFEKLELGIILGETWGKDVASVFLTVGIYKVRFFTFKPPLEIKKVMVGLEYLDDSERICDYDLYAKRKKLHWDQTRTDDVKGKRELGVYYRNIILEQLSADEKEVLFEMEKEIRSSKSFDYKSSK